MGRPFEKVFCEYEILLYCYWVGITIIYVNKEFKTFRFYYMDVFVRSYTSQTVDVGVYQRSSRRSIYALEHLCFL